MQAPLSISLALSHLVTAGTARPAAALAILAACLSLAMPAAAQGADVPPAWESPSQSQSQSQTSGASGSTTMGSGWWMPGSGRTTLGLNLGRSDYKVNCGNAFACDDTDRYWSLYGRNMATDMWGSELAFVDMGRIERAGGTTRARGLNISLVGKVPIAQSFGAFGKVGALYGRTRTSTAAGADIAAGNENGFGLSVGAGLSWDFSPKMSAVLEWDRYNFKFQDGRDGVNTASLGLQYRY